MQQQLQTVQGPGAGNAVGGARLQLFTLTRAVRDPLTRSNTVITSSSRKALPRSPVELLRERQGQTQLLMVCPSSCRGPAYLLQHAREGPCGGGSRTEFILDDISPFFVSHAARQGSRAQLTEVIGLSRLGSQGSEPV
jgi:hypothetical protein